MATLSQYFERHDTPMADSPVGRTMAKVLAKYPEMTFEAGSRRSTRLVGRCCEAPEICRASSLERRGKSRSCCRDEGSICPVEAATCRGTYGHRRLDHLNEGWSAQRSHPAAHIIFPASGISTTASAQQMQSFAFGRWS